MYFASFFIAAYGFSREPPRGGTVALPSSNLRLVCIRWQRCVCVLSALCVCRSVFLCSAFESGYSNFDVTYMCVSSRIASSCSDSESRVTLACMPHPYHVADSRIAGRLGKSRLSKPSIEFSRARALFLDLDTYWPFFHPCVSLFFFFLHIAGFFA